MHRARSFFFLAILILIIPLNANAEIATQMVEIRSDGIEMAAAPALVRDTALGNALEKVVERVVGSLISTGTMVQYEGLLKDSVYPKAKSYILNYTIVSEGTENGLFTVTVRAAVAVDSIRKDLEKLGVISVRGGLRPVTMILVAEQRVGDAAPRYRTRQTEPSLSEVYLRRSFTEDGFPLIDRMTVADAGGYFGPDFENTQIAFLGRQCGADLVVAVRSIVQVLQDGQGGRGERLRAYTEGKALKTDKSVVIGTAHWDAEVPFGHIESEEEAVLKDVVERMAATLRDRIRAKWEKNVPERQVVMLTINGIEHFADYQQIKQMCESGLQGVAAVRQKRMERGLAVLEMDIKRAILSIADELSVKAFNSFSLDVINVAEDSIEVRIIK